MVLLCHSERRLWMKQRIRGRKQRVIDANENYWKESYLKDGKPNRLSYEQLRSIYLEDIVFDREGSAPFIFVPSWRQPAPLVELAEQLERQRKVSQVQWYDEALARV